MAIINSAATFCGVGCQITQNIGAVITTAGSPNAVRVPASGSISPAVARGYLRFKVYNTTSAVTLTSCQVTAGDGTNTVTVDNFVPIATLSITSTAYVDYIADFILDTSTAGGGATGTVIFGGATFFTFSFVVATASGSCSADCEVVAEP